MEQGNQTTDGGASNSSQSTQSSGGGLFTTSPKPNPAAEQAEVLSGEVKTLTTRIRTLEEKARNLRAGIQMTEKNVLEDNKKVNSEIKDINQQVFELKKSFTEIKSKMDIIIKELALTAKHEDVESIQRYLNIWNPVHFVSQKEVTSVVKRALLELGIKTKHDVKIKDDISPEEIERETGTLSDQQKKQETEGF